MRVLAVAAVLGVLCFGCAPTRSVEAFCATYHDEKAAFIDKYNERQDAVDSMEGLDGIVLGLGSAIEAVGDTKVMFDKLEAVAPEEIQADVAAVRDSLQQQLEAAGEVASDPFGAFGSGLVSGLASMGSWDRVDHYIQENC